MNLHPHQESYPEEEGECLECYSSPPPTPATGYVSRPPKVPLWARNQTKEPARVPWYHCFHFLCPKRKVWAADVENHWQQDYPRSVERRVPQKTRVEHPPPEHPSVTTVQKKQEARKKLSECRPYASASDLRALAKKKETKNQVYHLAKKKLSETNLELDPVHRALAHRSLAQRAQRMGSQ